MSAFLAEHSLIATSIVKTVVLLFLVLTALAYLTWFERKVVGHIQSRWGPYRVGPHGLVATARRWPEVHHEGRSVPDWRG